MISAIKTFRPIRAKRASHCGPNIILGIGHMCRTSEINGTSGKKPTCQYRRHKRQGCDLWVWKNLWRRAWQPTPVFLPGESYGQRILAGYGP